MRHLRRVSLLGLAVVALLAGCSSGDGPTSPSPASHRATGTWRGTTSGLTLQLTLAQDGSVVTGSGSLSGPGGALALTATGTIASPSLSLTLSAPGFENLNVSGAFVSATAINATLNGSGFTGESIALLRQ